MQCAVLSADERAPWLPAAWGADARSIGPAIPQLRRGLHFLAGGWGGTSGLWRWSASSPCPICWTSRSAGKAGREAGHHPPVAASGQRDSKDPDALAEPLGTRPLQAWPYTFLAADALMLRVCEGGQTVNVHVVTMHYGKRIAAINQPRSSRRLPRNRIVSGWDTSK